MKRVAVLTTFFDVTTGFSVVTVAETQIRGLLDHGYDPVVIVQDGAWCARGDPQPFQELPPPSVWNRETVDLRAALPPMKLTASVPKDFEERVDAIKAVLEENLEGVDVCITHDVMLLDVYTAHNWAVRRYADTRPDLLWLHWIHSCPTPRRGVEYPAAGRFMPPPGYIVYPNDFDRGRVANAYGMEGQEWKVQVCRFGHAIDPLMAWPYDPLTKGLARKAGLLGGHVSAIYPVRLDKGKQPEKILYLLAGVQKIGWEPRLLVVDWQSAGKKFQQRIDALLQLAGELGLEGKVNFSSRLDDRCSQGVPRRVVQELFSLTNVYFHPSMVETYSLVVHEAALAGNLLVLNFDFPPMRELFGPQPVYMDFGSDREKRKYEPSEKAFWEGEALRLLAEMKQNRALMCKTRARMEWTPQALWPDFAPLLALRPVGER